MNLVSPHSLMASIFRRRAAVPEHAPDLPVSQLGEEETKSIASRAAPKIRASFDLVEPIIVDGVTVRRVDIRAPSRIDIEDLMAGRILETELHSRLSGLPLEAIDALSWPDADKLSDTCTLQLPRPLWPEAMRAKDDRLREAERSIMELAGRPRLSREQLHALMIDGDKLRPMRIMSGPLATPVEEN